LGGFFPKLALHLSPPGFLGKVSTEEPLDRLLGADLEANPYGTEKSVLAHGAAKVRLSVALVVSRLAVEQGRRHDADEQDERWLIHGSSLLLLVERGSARERFPSLFQDEAPAAGV